MSLADQIREFANERYVVPARAAGRADVIIRAGDVHSALGLSGRMPSVCQALESASFGAVYGLKLVARAGPERGANAVFKFAVVDRPHGTEVTAPISVAVPTPRSVRVPHVIPTAHARDSHDTVYLVACVAEKSAQPMEARELYLSDLFIKARTFVERRGGKWFILSALHGLVAPNRVLNPYDCTLNTMSAPQRRAWAARVIEQMRTELPTARRIVVLAGDSYRAHLMEHLQSICPDVTVPMEGLRIGEQLRWLGQNA